MNRSLTFLLGFVFLLSPVMVLSQQCTLTGTVTCNDDAVPFATITLRKQNKSIACDINGSYTFQNLDFGEYELLVTSIGFEPLKELVRLDQEVVSIDFQLIEATNVINEVAVTGTMRAMSVRQSPVKTEVISERFLESMPTYSVIESLNFVNGVQEVVNCGVCATNDIHINGMEGAYTLLLIDGMPIMSSLASVYGFNGIPNSLIEQIEIVKGPSSTLYGTEAVGGVINIITKSSGDLPLLSFGTSYSTHDEFNNDLIISTKLGDRVQSMISANYFRNDKRMDFNSDNFTDIPLNERLSLFNKWQFAKKDGTQWGSLAARYYTEDRFGGVLNWQQENIGSDSVYGEFINTNRLEVIGNVALPIEGFKFDFSYNLHDQDSHYGNSPYKANQHVAFGNLVWRKKFTNHFVTAGVTQRYQTYADNTFAASDDKRYIPGVFVQDEYLLSEKLTLMGGSRLDHHDAHGWIFAPRLNIKYSPADFTTFRINGGSGFRVVNLFTEDHAALTGSRQVVIAGELMPEESWNVNLNYNQVYQVGALGYGVLDVDVFNTWFSNKIVPDYTVDPNLIIYDNLDGNGVSRGVSISLNHTFSSKLDIMIGATYLDVFETLDGIKEAQLLTPEFSGKMKVSWTTPLAALVVDYSGLVTGRMHLPTYAAEFARDEISDAFALHHLQVSKKMKQVKAFVGVKNIFNFTQESPLIDPANPFGENFDTAYAYGPLQTRRFVFGISWEVFGNKKADQVLAD